MIATLVENGLVEEAYKGISLFINIVIENNGFFEWYTIYGKPHGSVIFRGSARALMETIDALKQ